MKIIEKIKLAVAFILGFLVSLIQRFHEKLGETEERATDLMESQDRQFRREADHDQRLQKINTTDLSDAEIECLLSSVEHENCIASDKTKTPSGSVPRNG